MKARDDSSLKEFELEMAWISEETNKEFVRIPQEVVKNAEAEAKAEIEEEDMEA